MRPMRGPGVVLPHTALWCWDEYLALSPDQRRLARDIERAALQRERAKENDASHHDV